MLSDRHTRLLSESLDRMLTAQEREELARLLEQEESARDLLLHLKKDARAIYEMPRLRLPAAFRERVVQLIERRAMHGAQPPVIPAHSLPAWLPVAAAAALLIVVATASFFYFRKPDVPIAINSDPAPATEKEKVKPAPR